MIFTFHMKSGRDIQVEAEYMTINKENGNDLTGYKFEGLKVKGQCFYIRIDEIEAITYKE